MTQRDRVLALLKTGKWIKVQEMHKIAWRYGSILHRLREAGYMMRKRLQEGSRLEEWQLVTRKK